MLRRSFTTPCAAMHEHHAAVDAARKANSTRTWKEDNPSCIKRLELRLSYFRSIEVRVVVRVTRKLEV